MRFGVVGPAATRGGADGTPQVGIVPYLFGDNDVLGVGTDLVTYDSADNTRLLVSPSEYNPTLVAGGNVKLSGNATTSGVGIYRLVLSGSSNAGVTITQNGPDPLIVQDGAVTSANNSIAGTGIPDVRQQQPPWHELRGRHLHGRRQYADHRQPDRGQQRQCRKHHQGRPRPLTLTANNSFSGGANAVGGTLMCLGTPRAWARGVSRQMAVAVDLNGATARSPA